MEVKGAHPTPEALAKQELPILFALSSEEGHCNKECASEADGKLDVSHIEDAADDETGDEN